MRRLTALFLALAVTAAAQVRTTENKAILKQIIEAAQKQVKPALGEGASQCFTDANYAAFQRNNKARQIAQDAARSINFDKAVQGLRRLTGNQQDNILSELRSIRQKSVAENGGEFGPQSQTDAGVNAQQNIAAEIVKIVEARLGRHPTE